MDLDTAQRATVDQRRPSEQAERPAAPRRTSLTVLVLVFVGFVSLGLPDGLLGVAWPSIRQTFGLPLDALGALFFTTVCGYLAASLASGWVVRRTGVGMLLALSALATAVGLLTFALAPAWSAIVLIGVVAGLGGGAIDAGLNSYVALAHSPRLLTWLHACFGIGAAAGPAIMMTVLSAGQPWRVGYAIVGGGQLILGLCFLLTRRQWQPRPRAPSPRPPSHHEPVATPGAGAGRSDGASSGPSPRLAPPSADAGAQAPAGSLRARSGPTATPARLEREVRPLHWHPAVWLSILLFLVYTGVETAAGQWAYTLFVEGRAISPQAAGVAVSVYWGALAVGRLLAGLIADRVAPSSLTRWSMAGVLAGAVLIWLNLAPWVSVAGLGLMGLAAAPIFPALIGVTPHRFGAAEAATVIGFQVAAASLGIAGLPALAGVLAARLGLEVIPGLLIFASLLMLGLHEAVLRLTARPVSQPAPARSTGPM
jgi:fucose permease